MTSWMLWMNQQELVLFTWEDFCTADAGFSTIVIKICNLCSVIERFTFLCLLTYQIWASAAILILWKKLNCNFWWQNECRPSRDWVKNGMVIPFTLFRLLHVLQEGIHKGPFVQIRIKQMKPNLVDVISWLQSIVLRLFLLSTRYCIINNLKIDFAVTLHSPIAASVLSNYLAIIYL